MVVPSRSRPRAIALGLIALGLAARYPSLRCLAREICHPRAQIVRARGIADLLRLGLLLHGAHGRLGGAPPFFLRATLDADGVLALRAFAYVPRGRPDPGLDETEVRAAIEERRGTTIMWDNSAVGGRLELEPRYGGPLHVGEDGIYRFDGIVPLLGLRAAVVADVLADLILAGHERVGAPAHSAERPRDTTSAPFCAGCRRSLRSL